VLVALTVDLKVEEIIRKENDLEKSNITKNMFLISVYNICLVHLLFILIVFYNDFFNLTEKEKL
jgi:hypothetical protein